MDAAVLLLRGALASYAAGALAAIVSWRRRGTSSPSIAASAPGFAGLGVLLHSMALVAAGAAAGRCPLATLPEVLSALGWALTLAALFVWWRSRLDAVLVIELPVACLVLLLSEVLPKDTVASGASPAFVRFHVTIILFGVAALSITFAASLLYLVVDRALKAKRPIAAFRRLPSLEACDRLAYRSLAVAFTLLTLGILSGAVVNGLETGHPWTWRPEETLAILAWILLGILMAARLGWGWRGRRASLLMVLGFALVLLRMLGL